MLTALNDCTDWKASASALLRRKSLGKRNGTGNSTQPAITCSKSTTETRTSWFKVSNQGSMMTSMALLCCF